MLLRYSIWSSELALTFLTTRVSSPDIDDLGKLKRVMRYLRDIKDLALTVEASDDGVVRWWVDASFAVHPNMRSHTSAVMTLGDGAVYGKLSKQKINAKSSCEAELVGEKIPCPQSYGYCSF
jgi:hypothetical protein